MTRIHPLLLAALAFFFWSIMDVGIKLLGENYHLSGAAIASFLVFSRVLWETPYHFRKGHRTNYRTRNWPWYILTGSLGAISAIIVFSAFGKYPIANVYVLIFTMPLWSALLGAIFLHEHLTWRMILAIALGFIGIVIGKYSGLQGFTPGQMLLLIPAFLNASGQILQRHFRDQDSLEAQSTWPILTCASLCLIYAVVRGEALPTGWAWAFFPVMGLFSAGAAICFLTALRRMPAAKVTATQYSQILWGSLFGFVIFNDSISPMVLLAGAFIMVAGWLLYADKKPPLVKMEPAE